MSRKPIEKENVSGVNGKRRKGYRILLVMASVAAETYELLRVVDFQPVLLHVAWPLLGALLYI